MSDELARRYLATWNERDPVKRRALIDELWTEDAGYVDPIATADGRAAIDDVVATAQQQFPGLVHRLAGSVDSHHHVARLTWELGPEDGPPVIIGLAVLIIEQARVRRVYGFLDHTPPPGARR